VIDRSALRAIAAELSIEPEGNEGWTYAPLHVPGEIDGYLIDVAAQRIVPLARGETLLADERRLAQHGFPGRWFEASFILVSLMDGVARVSDARATNGAIVEGAPLPTATWVFALDTADVVALVAGDASERIARLRPAWRTADPDAGRQPRACQFVKRPRAT
jgi:hypothetical protein